MSNLEQALALQMRGLKLPEPVREHRFDTVRRWRFDFAWPDIKLAVEVEGGVWSGGRHTRGGGFVADCDKYNAAAELGWVVLRYTSSQINDLSAIEQIKRILKSKMQ